MKAYENASRFQLPPRLPIIVRVDGKAFHTWTRGLRRPYDPTLVSAMDTVCLKLANEMDGAVLGYVQSDEISILLHTYKTFQTAPWFGGGLQKIASVAAGIASATLTAESYLVHGQMNPAVFDGRAFAVPEHDVCNYFLWRQQDAIRNSVQMLARTLFSHKDCHKKNTGHLRRLCREAGHEWADMPEGWRQGRAVMKGPPDDLGRTRWQVLPAPRFSRMNESFVSQFLAQQASTARPEEDAREVWRAAAPPATAARLRQRIEANNGDIFHEEVAHHESVEYTFHPPLGADFDEWASYLDAPLKKGNLP